MTGKLGDRHLAARAKIDRLWPTEALGRGDDALGRRRLRITHACFTNVCVITHLV